MSGEVLLCAVWIWCVSRTSPGSAAWARGEVGLSCWGCTARGPSQQWPISCSVENSSVFWTILCQRQPGCVNAFPFQLRPSMCLWGNNKTGKLKSIFTKVALYWTLVTLAIGIYFEMFMLYICYWQPSQFPVWYEFYDFYWGLSVTGCRRLTWLICFSAVCGELDQSLRLLLDC